MESGQNKQKEAKPKSVLELALDAHRRVKNKEMQLAKAKLDEAEFVAENLPEKEASAYYRKVAEMDRRMEDKIGFVGYKAFQHVQAFQQRLDDFERLNKLRSSQEGANPLPERNDAEERQVILQRA